MRRDRGNGSDAPRRCVLKRSMSVYRAPPSANATLGDMAHASALELSLALDARSLEPDTPSRLHLVAELRAIAAGIEKARPPLSIVFTIDASGSMSGPPIEHVIQSIDRIVALLEPTDRVGVVAFSDGASEMVPLVH